MLVADGELAGPSRPIPAHLAEMAPAALGNLDTPAAITLLRGLDRVLGLDLPSGIGK